VFGDKVEVVDEPHRLAQARMQERPRQRIAVDPLEPVEQPKTRRPQIPEEVPDPAIVVTGLAGLAVGQIRRGKIGRARQEVADPGVPERFEVEQMTGMLLDGPLPRVVPDERLAGQVPQELFDARGRAAEANPQVRIKFDRKRELKATLEPWWWAAQGTLLRSTERLFLLP